MRKIGESLPFEEGTKAIIAFVVLAIVIFGVVTFLIGGKLGGGGGGNLLQSVRNILPSFGEQPAIAPGVAIVGIYIGPVEDPVSASQGAVTRPSVLAHYLFGYENLSYYTGTKWVELKNNEVRIEQKVMDATMVRDALARFYFSTQRIGEPNFALENYQRMQVYIPSSQGGLGDQAFDGKGSLVVSYGVQEGYAGDPRNQEKYFALNDKFYSDKELRREVKQPVEQASKLVAWRDQLFSGAQCEKTIELSFNESGELHTNRYAVVKIEQKDGFYAYVDLNAPLDAGIDSDKYGAGCFVDDSLIASSENEFVNTGSVLIEVTDRDVSMKYAIFWLPSNSGVGRWYFVNKNYAPKVCEIRGGCSFVEVSELEASNFYLGLNAILKSSFVEENGLRIFILPHMIPAYYDSSSDYASFIPEEPSILYAGVAPYPELDKLPSADVLLQSMTSAYNTHTRAPENYYVYPYRYLPANTPQDKQGGYYRFYSENSELPLFVGHNVTGLQIYYASGEFNAATSFPQWDGARGLTHVGSLVPLGEDYQISMDTGLINDVPENVLAHLRNLDGKSLSGMTFADYNYP